MRARLSLLIIVLVFLGVDAARRRLANGEFTNSDSPATPSSSSSSAADPAPKPKSKSSLAQIFAPKPGAPPTRKTWGNVASLADHFARHGADFRAKDADEYARLAWEFGQKGKRGGLLAKVDDDGTLRVFDPKTGAFGAYNSDGTTKTFFKPNSRDYFARQPGRSLNTPRL